MSESIYTTAEPTKASEYYNPLTKGEIEQYMAELEARGVLAELLCYECGTTVEPHFHPKRKATRISGPSAGAVQRIAFER